MIREVTMYRAECDHVGCSASAQDEGDFYAWKEPDAAEQEALDDFDWYRDDGRLLCRDHWPTCASDGCSVQIPSDEFGAFCEDHEPASSAPVGGK